MTNFLDFFQPVSRRMRRLCRFKLKCRFSYGILLPLRKVWIGFSLGLVFFYTFFQFQKHIGKNCWRMTRKKVVSKFQENFRLFCSFQEFINNQQLPSVKLLIDESVLNYSENLQWEIGDDSMKFNRFHFTYTYRKRIHMT